MTVKTTSRPGYKKTTLGKIAPDITSGSRGWASFYAEKGALFLRMTNLPKNGIGLLLNDNKYVSLPDGSSEGIRTRVQSGDILISITAELGKIGFVETDLGEAYVNQHVALVRLKDPSVDSKYLAYYLASHPQRIRLNRLNDSGAKAGLSLRTISTLPLELPPLPEQKAIAEVLSVWDRAIEKTERLIQAKERRFKGLLQSLMNPADKSGWKVVRLRDVATINKGTQRNRDGLDDSGAYPAMNGGIGPSGYTDKWNTEENTITISEGGNSCGFVNYITQRFWCGGHCYALVRLSNQIENAYLFHFLKHHEPALMRLRVGSGLPNVQKRDIDAFSVQFPPICDQKRIAETLNLAQREIDLLKKLAEKQKLQKRGLMQKLLTGEWQVKTEK